MTTLEKIRAEIEAVGPKSYVQYGMRWTDSTLMIPFHRVMRIIDKYAEQEPTCPCDLCGFNTGEFCRYLGECPAIPKGGE